MIGLQYLSRRYPFYVAKLDSYGSLKCMIIFQHRYIKDVADTQAAENDGKKKGKQKKSKSTVTSTLNDDSNTR